MIIHYIFNFKNEQLNTFFLIFFFFFYLYLEFKCLSQLCYMRVHISQCLLNTSVLVQQGIQGCLIEIFTTRKYLTEQPISIKKLNEGLEENVRKVILSYLNCNFKYRFYFFSNKSQIVI